MWPESNGVGVGTWAAEHSTYTVPSQRHAGLGNTMRACDSQGPSKKLTGCV